MNMSDIAVKNMFVPGRKTAFGADSFLSIGKKGQTVEGTISSVSDRISINFNGIEVTVSRSAVQNATEGEVRKFKIMDVSKENIVLKEVGNSTVSNSTRVMMGTTVSASSHAFSEYLAGSQSISEAKRQAGESLAMLTGEDYQDIESEQGDLEEYKESVLDRAVERAKEKKQQQQEQQENYHQSRQESQENVEIMQAQGFLAQKSPDQIAQALRESDLPVSDAVIAKICAAMQMAQVVSDLSDNARAYIVENQLTPTIENLYHGQYSGSGGRSADIVDDDTWQEILPQVKGILAENGIDLDNGLRQAKWLFANDLPVTVQSLQTMETLEQIQGETTADQVLEQILQAMSAGSAPEKATLDIRQFVIAKSLIRDFARVTEQNVKDAVQTTQGDDITLALLKQAGSTGSVQGASPGETVQGQEKNAGQQVAAASQTDTERATLITQRRLEEIRLKMTVQAAIRMSGKGINVEVTPLKQLVEQLRQMENDYYKETVTEKADSITEVQTDLMQETLRKAEYIKNAPAALLGASVKQQSLLTVNELHRAAVSQTARMRQYQSDYEAVGTQVREDLGDSIQKAFDTIPDLLRELGLEDTKANERAVRILGYNQMEITEENISLVKEQDARVNSIINNMKPTVVLEMIRQGENPLQTPLPELDERLRRLAEEKNIDDDEKYSRFLWRLEQDGSISPQEREGYIGIYRLLNQIEKTDGAAVGAVLDTQKDMTLHNLLTAVRTIRGKGIDAEIDDTFGALQDIQYMRHSISEQIENAFREDFSQDSDGGNEQSFMGNQAEAAASLEAEGQRDYDSRAEYYDRLTRQTLDIVTPSALKQISDGDMQRLLDTSVERLKEQLEEAEGNQEIEAAMYDHLADELRDTVAQDDKAAQYLARMDIPDTIANINAMKHILEQGYDVQKELFDRRRVLDEREQQDYEKLLQSMPESLDSDETMMEHSERLEAFMEQILDRSYEQTDVSYSDLRALKLLGQGIWLQKQLTRRQSYDIPIETGDSITCMNVTLVQGMEDSGKVQIFLSGPSEEQDPAEFQPEYGDISIELRVSGDEIKGLVLCENREYFELFSSQQESLTTSLEEKDFVVMSLSYGMNHMAREDLTTSERVAQVPTTRLYQAAKVIVQHTMEILKENS